MSTEPQHPFNDSLNQRLDSILPNLLAASVDGGARDATSENVLISIVEIRQLPRFMEYNCPLWHSIQKGSVQNLERLEFSFHPSEVVEAFAATLSQISKCTRGEMIYLASRDVYAGPDFCRFLQELRFHLRFNARTVASFNTLHLSRCNDPAMTAPAATFDPTAPSFLQDLTQIPHLQTGILNPVSILPHFVFGKDAFAELAQFVRDSNAPDTASLAKALFRWLTDKRSPQSHISVAPVAFCLPDVELLAIQGAELTRAGAVAESVFRLTEAKDRGFQGKGLESSLGFAHSRGGNFREAQLAFRRELSAYPNSDGVRASLAHLQELGVESDVRYRIMQGSVDSVWGWMLPGQEYFLFRKVRDLPDYSTVLEVGSCHGRSTAAMAFACLGTNKRIVSVDAWGTHKGPQYARADSLYMFDDTIARLGLQGYVTRYQGPSAEVLKGLQGKHRFQFAFIDAGHKYKDVLDDLTFALPLMAPEAWLAFHDMRYECPGVWQVWHESAAPLLLHHEYCSSLACGQLAPGYTLKSPEEGNFDLPQEYLRYVSEMCPFNWPFWEAMELSISETCPNFGRADEEVIARVPGDIALFLEILATAEPGSLDYAPTALRGGAIEYWHALVLLGKGQKTDARAFLQRARARALPTLATRIDAALGCC